MKKIQTEPPEDKGSTENGAGVVVSGAMGTGALERAAAAVGGGPDLGPSVARGLARSGLMAILRSRSGEHLRAAALTLFECGVTCLEVTVPTPGSFDVVGELASVPDVLVGMGTVTTRRETDAAAAAGACFIVSPHTDPGLVEYARGLGLAAFPGAMTPTEVLAAHRAGATAVKLFPAGSLGTGYLRSLRAPFPDIPVVATGGIHAGDVADWLAAGAVAVGVADPLLGDALTGGSLADLRTRARRFVRAAGSRS